MMTKNTTDCDESCDCHHGQKLKEVGNNVWMDENGGSGPSDRMKKLLKMKDLKKNMGK